MKNRGLIVGVIVGAAVLFAACGGGGHAKSAAKASPTTPTTPATYKPPYTGYVPPLPTAAPPIATTADACAKIESVSDPNSGGRDAVVAALPQLRAVFAGVPSDSGPPYVVVPGVDDGTQLQLMLIWCFGHNDGR